MRPSIRKQATLSLQAHGELGVFTYIREKVHDVYILNSLALKCRRMASVPHPYRAFTKTRGFGKLHFLFGETHVLPATNLGCRDSNPLSSGFHPAPYCEDVTVGHSRRRHSNCRVDCVIVSLDKFRQNVYITVGIAGSKIFERSISQCPVSTFYDRTFDVGIFANLKLTGLVTQHVLKMFI